MLISLTIQIADKEIDRKEELSKTLDYLSQQFAHLQLANSLPEDFEQRDFIANRALDVRSATMMYLAIMIRHNSTAFGTLGSTLECIQLNGLGKVVKTFLLGDLKVTNSKAYLDTCVVNYSRALIDIIGVPMIIEVREIVKGT